MSAATKVSPFEFAHAFHARVPLTLGLPDLVTSTDEIPDKQAVTLAKRIADCHIAASDHMAAAQVWMGQLLEKRSIPSAVKVGDKVWLDLKHTPVDIPYKLTARSFGPSDSEYWRHKVPRSRSTSQKPLVKHITRSINAG